MRVMGEFSPVTERHNTTLNHVRVEESHTIQVEFQLHSLLIESLPFLQLGVTIALDKRLKVDSVLERKSFVA